MSDAPPTPGRTEEDAARDAHALLRARDAATAPDFSALWREAQARPPRRTLSSLSLGLAAAAVAALALGSFGLATRSAPVRLQGIALAREPEPLGFLLSLPPASLSERAR